jgi:translocation and assembly module TamB
MRALRTAGKALAWVLLALVSLVASVAYHLSLPASRVVVRDLLCDLASDALRGDLAIGAIDELGLGRVVVHDVVLSDEEGRPVIEAGLVTIVPDLGAFLADGTIRIAGAHVQRPEISLYVVGDDGLEVSFVRTFLPAHPGPPGGEPVHIVIDGLWVEDGRVRGDVPRYPGLAIDGLDARAQLDIRGDVLVQVYGAHARMVGPYPGLTELDPIDVRFSTDWQDGLTAYVAARRGDDRATVDVRVDRPEGWLDDAPPRVSIVAHLDPLCMNTLADMGFPGLSSLAGCARGWARLEGPANDLALSAALAHDAGAVWLTGSLATDAPMSFEASTEGLELATLVPSAPAMRYAGHARIELVDVPGDPTRGVLQLHAEPLSVAGYAIPAFDATGSITDDEVLLEGVHAPHLEGEVVVRGRAGFDGSLDLDATLDVADVGADPNVARLVPGAHGSARGHLDITSGPAASHLAIDGDVDIAQVRYGPVRARRLRGHVWLRGAEPLPELSTHLLGDDVVVSGVSLGRVDLTGEGGGARPLTVRALGTGGRHLHSSDVQARITRSGDTTTVALDRYDVDLGLGTYHGVVASGHPPRVIVRGGRIVLDGLELAGQDHSDVVVSGALVPRGESDLHATLRAFDLTTLAPLLPPGLAHLSGRLSADAHVQGRLADPRIVLGGHVDDASLDGQRGFELAYELRYADGRLDTRVDGDLGARGGLHVEGPILAPWAVLTDPARLADEGRLDGLEIDIDRANIAFLLPFLGERVAGYDLAGRITTAVVLSGRPSDLDVPRAVVILDNFGPDGWTPIRGKAELSYVDDELRVDRVWIADAAGELLLGEAGTRVSVVDPPASAAGWLARIADAGWWMAVRVEPRRLDQWPRPLGKTLPQGIVAGGSLTLFGDAHGTSGNLEGVVRWDEAAVDAPCARALRPNLQIHARTDEGVTNFVVDAFAEGRHVAHAMADAPTPIHDWIATATAAVPPTDVRVRLTHMLLEDIPWTCAYVSGDATGEVRVTLGNDEPDLDAALEVASLVVHGPDDAPPAPARHAAFSVATAGRGDGAVTLCAILSESEDVRTPVARCPEAPTLASDPHGLVVEDGEVAWAASVPLTFSALEPPALRDDAPLTLWTDFENAHLAPLLALLPTIVDADLVANGTVVAQGPWENIQFSGGVDLRDGHARIASVGQHLHGIGGVLRMDGNRIVLPEDRPLTVRDGEGLAEASGEVTFAGLFPTLARIDIDPDHFPVRREGATLATLTGHSVLSASIERDGVEAQLEVQELEVGLPPSLTGAVQSLEPRHDVFLVGSDGPELSGRFVTHFPYHLRVSAPRVVVARNDFSADVRADLDVTYNDPDLFIGGAAEITRGTFEVLGKRFTVQRGAIVFDGGSELDPDISLVANYALPGRRGATVTITVSGHLTSLAVDFSSTESSDTGEILALLVSGRTSRPSDAASVQQAGDQAANFVSGITAGIATLFLQQQFGGDFVPNVAIETGDRFSSLGVRVGFNADWIIPDFMREIVLDAYLEGFFATMNQQQQQASGSSGGVGGGASIELQLPLNGVLSGTYVPPTSWGTDLTWEP